MTEFLMPRLGADMDSGRLVEWRKQPGDPVARGDIVAEVETDKGEIEVESFTTGVLDRLLVEPGTIVPVGTPLATITTNGEVTHPAAAAEPAEFRPVRVPVSPAARKLAGERHVDPESLHGTGPGGRVLRRDVEGATTPDRAETIAAPPAAAAPEASAPPPARTAPSVRPDAVPAGTGTDEFGLRMRRSIATAMARSKREIPHFYLRTTIDMSTALNWLGDENERRSVQDRLLYGVLLVKATALALREVPELNATWQDAGAVTEERVHVGVAVALRGGGLVAPAIHDTDAQTLDQLMTAFRDLVTRARAGRLRASELSDPTITVTSLGERGVEEAYGVIVPPQVAIVGFGSIVERPWVFQGRVLPCPVITATLAADHRVTDGHRAGLLLTAIDRLLQEPDQL